MVYCWYLASLLFDLFRKVGTVQKLIHEILNYHPLPIHPHTQPMEIGLEFVIIDGRVHAVKGDVDEIAGDDVTSAIVSDSSVLTRSKAPWISAM